MLIRVYFVNLKGGDVKLNFDPLLVRKDIFFLGMYVCVYTCV